MSARHLGETFDIHARWPRPIFPHHENEIAQSRSTSATPSWRSTGCTMASLNISGEKMSKSLGNFFTVHELLDQHPAEAIRLLCSRRSTASRSTSRMRG
jgi:cysteinyl-tRNA synthetase